MKLLGREAVLFSDDRAAAIIMGDLPYLVVAPRKNSKEAATPPEGWDAFDYNLDACREFFERTYIIPREAGA